MTQAEFDLVDIVNELRNLRIEANLTQKDLAKMTGMRRRQYISFETLEHIPRLDRFMNIVDKFGYKVVLVPKDPK
jgi:transcriptional regulator with XRE-family HTH domain